LPPQLLLEVLDSIQYLLFPNDKRSIQSLDNFIDKYDFDPQAKLHEGRVRQLPEEFEYKYLGDRLVTLLNIVKNPPAANRIVAWFDRHARDRNTLAIAALGLFLTALFGFLSMHLHELCPSCGCVGYVKLTPARPDRRYCLCSLWRKAIQNRCAGFADFSNAIVGAVVTSTGRVALSPHIVI